MCGAGNRYNFAMGDDDRGLAPTPLGFSALRLLADGDFHSGVALARALAVSRASVSNALRGVERFGVELYRIHGRGYRSVTPLVWLERERLSNALGGAERAFDVELLDCVDSTSTRLLAKADAGAASGSVVAAELQTAGRGRLGRSWHAALGSALTFSLLWRFQQGAASLSGLSLAVGVALARALAAHGVDAQLKWPNDVLWRGRKLAGILIEMRGDALGPSAAVIGVGLNVRLGAGDRARIGQPAADLADAGADTLDRNRLLAGLLLELRATLETFAARGFPAFAQEWQRRNAHRDKTVTLIQPGGAREHGRVEGVAADGALLLKLRSGVKRYVSGELSLRATDAR